MALFPTSAVCWFHEHHPLNHLELQKSLAFCVEIVFLFFRFLNLLKMCETLYFEFVKFVVQPKVWLFLKFSSKIFQLIRLI